MTLNSIALRLRTHPSIRYAGLAGVVLVGAGMSAHAALRAIADPPAAVVAPMPPATGYEAEDHFPGAAFLYAADDHAAPASGTTGTIALPDLPIPADAAAKFAVTPDRSVTPAQPFSTRLAGPVDRGRALECLTAAIYYEAATEPTTGSARSRR